MQWQKKYDFNHWIWNFIIFIDMKLRVIKKGFRYHCQYKTFLFWWNFKDKRLNKNSNLNVWFGNELAALNWIENLHKAVYD